MARTESSVPHSTTPARVQPLADRRRQKAGGARAHDVLEVPGGNARRHVAHEVSGATSRLREKWRQRVQAPPKQLITTRRPVCLPQQQPGFP